MWISSQFVNFQKISKGPSCLTWHWCTSTSKKTACGYLLLIELNAGAILKQGPHPRMVNLTTASLEPAPLSSGWKSGSLPTGFTPTILGEPGQGGSDAAGFKPDGEAVPGEEAAGGAGRPRPGLRRRRPRRLLPAALSQCRVTPGSRAAEGVPSLLNIPPTSHPIPLL